jgi:hypothetical protein
MMDGRIGAMRTALEGAGFKDVAIENAYVRMPASRTAPNHPWVRWAQASMQQSLDKRVQIIPNSSGGLPGDVFIDHVGTPLGIASYAGRLPERFGVWSENIRALAKCENVHVKLGGLAIRARSSATDSLGSLARRR